MTHPPQGPSPQQESTQPATAQSRSGGIGVRKVLGIAGAVAVLAAVAVGYFLSQDGADRAAAGDCLKNNGDPIFPDLRVVDCGDADALYKVVRVLPDTVDTARCQGVSDIGYEEQADRARHKSGKQFVLCLDGIDGIKKK
ncbi:MULTISPECIES: LppU/SCO3897 family protein [unclassified Streptomyces]|uniref:LppU/SCO3897 family protein n=1 Tax=unclassified Streptomyces TaxID=2593676 RepID=UPI002E292938|nr:hypothetical protein [Streptomyces sp. NBC_01439]